MQVPPEVHRQVYEATRAAIVAGQLSLDSRVGDNPVTLAVWVRVRKLAALVGDLPKVLAHLGISAQDYRGADDFFPYVVAQPEMQARHDLLHERSDVGEEAAQIAASPGASSGAALEPDAVIVLGPGGRLCLVGHALRAGQVQLRALDLETRAPVWEGAAGALSWAAAPARGRYQALGQRLALIHEARLHLIDLADGRLLWSAPLPGTVEQSAAEQVQIHELLPGEARGVLAVRSYTPRQTLFAFDRESGAQLWSADLDGEQLLDLLPLPGLGVALHAAARAPAPPPDPFGALPPPAPWPEASWVTVLDARSGAVLSRVGARRLGGDRPPWVRAFGALLLVEQAPFLALIDPRSGRALELVRRVVGERPEALLDLGGRPVWLTAMHGKVGLGWSEASPDPAAQQRGERLERGSLLDAAMEPGKLAACLVDTALALLRPWHRPTPAYEVDAALVVLDARSLARRFEIPLGKETAAFLGAPSMMALGALLVLATESEGAHRLRAFDTRNGQLVWQAPLTSPRSISLLGGALVIEGYAGVTVRRASDGVEIARWP